MRVVVAEIPVPIESPQQIVDAVLAHVTGRTRIVLLDHISSPSAVIFPIEQLVPRLEERGVEMLIDGAHALGMIDVDLLRIGATFYTGNCHKWLCAPRDAGFPQRSPRPAGANRAAGNQPRLQPSAGRL